MKKNHLTFDCTPVEIYTKFSSCADTVTLSIKLDRDLAESLESWVNHAKLHKNSLFSKRDYIINQAIFDFVKELKEKEYPLEEN